MKQSKITNFFKSDSKLESKVKPLKDELKTLTSIKNKILNKKINRMKRISLGWKELKNLGLDSGMKWSPSNQFKQEVIYRLSKHKKTVEQQLFQHQVEDAKFSFNSSLFELKSNRNKHIAKRLIQGDYKLLQTMVDNDIHINSSEFKDFKKAIFEKFQNKKIGLKVNKSHYLSLHNDHPEVWSTFKKWLTNNYVNIIEEDEFGSDEVNELKGEVIKEIELIELKPGKKLGNKQVKFFNYKNDSPIDLSRYQIYSESQLYYLLRQQNQNKGMSSKMKLLWELTMTEEKKKP